MLDQTTTRRSVTYTLSKKICTPKLYFLTPPLAAVTRVTRYLNWLMLLKLVSPQGPQLPPPTSDSIYLLVFFRFILFYFKKCTIPPLPILAKCHNPHLSIWFEGEWLEIWLRIFTVRRIHHSPPSLSCTANYIFSRENKH